MDFNSQINELAFFKNGIPFIIFLFHHTDPIILWQEALTMILSGFCFAKLDQFELLDLSKRS